MNSNCFSFQSHFNSVNFRMASTIQKRYLFFPKITFSENTISYFFDFGLQYLSLSYFKNVNVFFYFENQCSYLRGNYNSLPYCLLFWYNSTVMSSNLMHFNLFEAFSSLTYVFRQLRSFRGFFSILLTSFNAFLVRIAPI